MGFRFCFVEILRLESRDFIVNVIFIFDVIYFICLSFGGKRKISKRNKSYWSGFVCLLVIKERKFFFKVRFNKSFGSIGIFV